MAATFIIPGFLHETREEVLHAIYGVRIRNIEDEVVIQHEEISRIIVRAESCQTWATHWCQVLIQIEELPGRRTQVSVLDNTRDGKCARDGHLEEIAGAIREKWDRDFEYNSRHRR